MTELETILKCIRQNDQVRIDLDLDDYLKSSIRIYAYDKGEIVNIKKADWTDITGYRGLHSGTVDELEGELRRLFSFKLEVTEIFEGENTDESI